MDLSKITPSTIDVEIRHPGTGKATGLVIIAGSLESDAVKKVKRKQANKMLRSRNRKPNVDDLEENQIEMLVAAITDWKWNGDAAWGGKKLEFNEENVRSVLSTPWVRNQVEEAVSDEAAFF